MIVLNCPAIELGCCYWCCMLFVCRVEETYEVLEIKHVEIGNGDSVYVTYVEDPADFRVYTLCVDVEFCYDIV